MYRSPFICPVRCTSGYPFSPSGKPHGGEDYVPKDKNKETNWSLHAVSSGRVYISKKEHGRYPGGYGAYGNYLVIICDDGKWVLYAHMKKLPAVKAGDRVKRGQYVGTAGVTGNVTGRHLHIEVSDMRGVSYNGATWYRRLKEHRVKPSDYIDFEDYNGDKPILPDPTEKWYFSAYWHNGSTPEKVYNTDTDAAGKGRFGGLIRTLPPRYTAKCYVRRRLAGIYVYGIEYELPSDHTVRENGYVVYRGGIPIM